MASENILSISLKDYKKQIDDLKGSLLGLAKGSDDYQKVLDEVRDKQSKLTEVLNDCKKSAEPAANSMNMLKEQLKQLKQEAGNLDIGSEKFKELSGQILDTTNKLKSLEESQGTFSRNVGNYTGSMIDAFGQMGVNVKGLQGAFQVATEGSKGFSKVLTIIQKHPIVFTLTALVAIFIKIKDAIKGNEEASRKWETAMSAFKPLLDAIQKAIGFLAEKLADAALWFGSKLPKATEFLGKAFGGVIKGIGFVVKAFMQFGTVVPRIFTSVVDTVGSGIKFMTDKLGNFIASIPGLGKIGDAIKSVGDGIKKVTSTVDTGLKSMVNGATTFIDNLVNKMSGSVQTMGEKFSNASKKRMQEQQAEYALQDKIRQQQELGAASELKQAQLRDKIATASGQERLKLLAELRKEQEENGKRQIEIAQEQLRLAEYQAKLKPNSKEDNDRLAELRANVVAAEAAMEASFIRTDKMAAKTEASIASNATKAAKEAEKAAKESEKERLASIKEFVKQYNEQLKNIDTQEKSDTDKNKADEALLKSMGLLTPEKQIEIENKRYEIEKEANDKRIALTKETIDAGKLLEEDAYNYTVRLQAMVQDAKTDEMNHIANINKIKLDEINKDTEEKLSEQEAIWKSMDLVSFYTDAFAGLKPEQAIDLVSQLSISDEQKEQILANLQQLLDDEKAGTSTYYIEAEEAEHEHWLEMLRINQTAIDQMAEIYGSDSEIVLEAQRKQNEAMEKEEERHVGAMAELRKKDTKGHEKDVKDKIKATVQLAKSTASLMGTVSDIMQDSIEQRVKNGEITEEEAEKEFENVKKAQIAETVINTIAGAAGAFMQDMKSYPSPFNAIIAGVDMATALTMGALQISKIKQSTFSNGGSVSGGSGEASRGTTSIDFSGVSVSPILSEDSDIANMQSLNVQGDSTGDNKVYILQSELEDSHNQVQIRQSNAVF